MFGKILLSALASFLSVGTIQNSQYVAPAIQMQNNVMQSERTIENTKLPDTSNAYEMRGQELAGKVGETWKAEFQFRPNNRSVDNQKQYGYDVRERTKSTRATTVNFAPTRQIKNNPSVNYRRNLSDIQLKSRNKRSSVATARGINTRAIRLKKPKGTSLEQKDSIYTSNINALRPWDHIRGNPETDISLIEYTDLECPFCAKFHPTMLQILKMYKDDVHWVYRPYPLSFHTHAMTGAIAAECVSQIAGDSAFWNFVDMVYEKGADTNLYPLYATELGIDSIALTECMKNKSASDDIDTEIKAASNAGVTGTPYLSIVNHANGKSTTLQGAQPIGSVQEAIEAILE